MSEIDNRLAAVIPASEPRRTLAMRLAERNGQRELRAARLARLRGDAAAGRVPSPPKAVLEVYLPAAEPAAVAGPAPQPPTAQPPASPAMPEAAEELARLLGVGPGLAAAFGRAGITRLADLAALEPAAFAAR